MVGSPVEASFTVGNPAVGATGVPLARVSALLTVSATKTTVSVAFRLSLERSTLPNASFAGPVSTTRDLSGRHSTARTRPGTNAWSCRP